MRRRHLTLSREGMVYVALMTIVMCGAVLKQINLLMILYGLLVGALLLNWRWVRKTLYRLEVRRRVPATIAAGELLTVGIEVTNRRRRLPSWAVLLEDSVTGLGPAATEPIVATTMVGHLSPRSTRTASYRGRLVRRGRYRFGPLRMSTRFPFGLLRFAVRVDQPQEMLVLPRFGRLSNQWRRLAASIDSGSAHAQRRLNRAEGDFHGLREWRPDDNRRWVHWRTSARRQTLVVRQFEEPRRQDMAIVLDLWQPPKPTATDREYVELAVSFAATLIDEAVRSGRGHLWLNVSSPEPRRFQGPVSPALASDMLEGLAVVEATNADRLPDVLGQSIDELRPGTRVVVISTRPVELDDDARFGAACWTGRRRVWKDRMICLDMSDARVDRYFSMS